MYNNVYHMLQRVINRRSLVSEEISFFWLVWYLGPF